MPGDSFELKLWFDVDFQQDTTISACKSKNSWLWFDVDFQQDTTSARNSLNADGCGLM